MNYFQFTKRFPTENAAIDYIVEKKYQDGYYCPKCGCNHNRIYHQSYDRRKLYCNNCKSEFSAMTGTIFENTHLDIRMWLYAINLVTIAKEGTSAMQLQRELGIGSYKCAWRMMQKIRSAIANENMKDVFEAVVEIDETYVGGKPRKSNVHTERETNEKFNKRGEVHPRLLLSVLRKEAQVRFTQSLLTTMTRENNLLVNNFSIIEKSMQGWCNSYDRPI